MNITTNITVVDQATPAIQALQAGVQPDRLAARVGPACAQMTRAYLRGRPKNKRGWPTTNFWQRASRATSWQAVQGGVIIRINQIGVRQRYLGGPISPVRARALTIPILPQAYGKTASDFPGSFLIKTRKGTYIVQYGGAVSKTGRGVNKNNATIEFLFKLSSGVNQRPDPTVLPPDDAYYVTAHQAIKAGLTRTLNSQPSTLN